MNYVQKSKQMIYFWFGCTVGLSVVLTILLSSVEVTEADETLAATDGSAPNIPFGASFAPLYDITFPVGNYPQPVAYASQLNYVYFNTTTYATLFRVDLNNGAQIALFEANNIQLGMTQDDQYLLMLDGSFPDGRVRLMDTATNQISASYTIPYSPRIITVGNRLFVGYSDRIDVYNALTGQFLASAVSGSDATFAVSWDRTRLYAATTDFKLWQYDISNGVFTLLQTQTVGQSLTALAVTGDGSMLVSAVTFSPTIYLYSTTNLTLADTIPTEYAVHGVGADHDYIYAVRRFYAGNSYLRAYDLVTKEPRHHYRPGSDALFPQLVVRGDGTVGVFVEANPMRFQLLTPTFYGVAMPVLLRDYCAQSFIDTFDSPDTGWPVSTSGAITYQYLNGEYRIYHHNSNTWGAATRGDSWYPGVQLAASKGRLASGGGYWGLVFGLNEDWSEFYTFEIAPQTQSWAVFHYTASSGWSVIQSGQSSQIHPTNMNELAIRDEVTYTSFEINDSTVYLMWGFPSGRVGLSSGSFAANTDVRYDDYVFTLPHCPQPTAPTGLMTYTSPDHIVPDRWIEGAILPKNE